MIDFYVNSKLDDIIQSPSKNNIKVSIKISAANLYHASVQSFVHSNNYMLIY